MKKITVIVVLLLICVGGIIYLFKRLRTQNSEIIFVNKKNNWRGWFEEKFPDQSKEIWMPETEGSLEKIIKKDGGKWNFICKGDIHNTGRPTVLMMRTEDTRTNMIAVKELKVMDCREGRKIDDWANSRRWPY